MSAPKTPEGKAASLAKQRETTRRRPTTELREDLKQFALRLRYAGESYRADLNEVRQLVTIAAGFVQETPADEEAIEYLRGINSVLLEVAVTQRRKRKARFAEERAERDRPEQERLRAQGAAILSSILSAEPEGGAQ
jgi:hypothetical protein